MKTPQEIKVTEEKKTRKFGKEEDPVYPSFSHSRNGRRRECRSKGRKRRAEGERETWLPLSCHLDFIVNSLH
ncbi:hypothetical protein PDJAM_G00190400 [Pangasius djambal]|uniref:Uncharacterized protein n=1 Tax=Pangasius djambal TaxID=1691987 RepID=A0ACC5Y5L1_9TELE|nr:hypothetical protein [Pangasius djambal]